MIQFIKNKIYRNKEMVSYWKKGDSVFAKVTKTPQGHYEMFMEGEKYAFPGHPRGVLLFGGLSPLKHQIKNKVFNEIWAALEAGVSDEIIYHYFKEQTLPEILKIGEKTWFDMVPPEKLNPPVKELWRAMTAIENGSVQFRKVKEILCFILQEDDAYRMRFQWIVKFIPRWWKPKMKHIELGLNLLEQAEVVGDMKERIRLFRRVVLFLLKDPAIKSRFDKLLQELNWNKLRLTKADKYFFRAKYFKVDYPEYQY